MAQDAGERSEGAQKGDAVQVEAGAAGAEIASWREGVWRYADHTSTDAEEAAAADTIADEERALVLQACGGECGVPCTGSTPARSEVQILG